MEGEKRRARGGSERAPWIGHFNVIPLTCCVKQSNFPSAWLCGGWDRGYTDYYSYKYQSHFHSDCRFISVIHCIIWVILRVYICDFSFILRFILKTLPPFIFDMVPPYISFLLFRPMSPKWFFLVISASSLRFILVQFFTTYVSVCHHPNRAVSLLIINNPLCILPPHWSCSSNIMH